jgi:hypothetical protein
MQKGIIKLGRTTVQKSKGIIPVNSIAVVKKCSVEHSHASIQTTSCFMLHPPFVPTLASKLTSLLFRTQGRPASHEDSLDTAAVAAAVPPAAMVSAVSRSVVGAVGPRVLADPVQTQEGRGEPAQRRYEGEGEVGLPLAAAAVEARTTPVEDVSVCPVLSV